MGRRPEARGDGNKKAKPQFISPSSSFSSSSSKLSRSVRRLPSLPRPTPAVPVVTGKNGKKAPSKRLWMRLDRRGSCEMLTCNRAFVAARSGVPARDLRVLGPLFSRCPSILAREKAMVINIEFVRAIVTADEVLLLEPLVQEVLPFVEKLRRHFPLKSLDVDVNDVDVDNYQDGKPAEHAPSMNEAAGGAECEPPFELQVLDLALQAVCLSFNSSVCDLNRRAISVLDDLAKNVSTRNLDSVRSLKSSLTSLLAGVQKVRDEVEHLLDDSERMAHLYLSTKQKENKQDEAIISSAASNDIFPSETNLGIATSVPLNIDMENLEMLLEAYFMQLDEIYNIILLVRRNIVDTEGYVTIRLDNKRNELIRIKLTLIIVSFGIVMNTFMAASFAMNIPHEGHHMIIGGPFGSFVGVTASFCLLVVVMLFGYAWKNGLLIS